MTHEGYFRSSQNFRDPNWAEISLLTPNREKKLVRPISGPSVAESMSPYSSNACVYYHYTKESKAEEEDEATIRLVGFLVFVRCSIA